jgi:hypothetical protein
VIKNILKWVYENGFVILATIAGFVFAWVIFYGGS